MSPLSFCEVFFLAERPVLTFTTLKTGVICTSPNGAVIRQYQNYSLLEAPISLLFFSSVAFFRPVIQEFLILILI